MLRFWAGKGLEADAPRRGRETLRGREGRPYELYPASRDAPVDPDGGLPAEPEPREALGLTAMAGAGSVGRSPAFVNNYS